MPARGSCTQVRAGGGSRERHVPMAPRPSRHAPPHRAWRGREGCGVRKQSQDLVPVADRPVRRSGGLCAPRRGTERGSALGLRGHAWAALAGSHLRARGHSAGTAPGLRAAEQGGQRLQVGLQGLQGVAELLCGRSLPLEVRVCRPLSQPRRRGQSLSGGSQRPRSKQSWRAPAGLDTAWRPGPARQHRRFLPPAPLRAPRTPRTPSPCLRQARIRDPKKTWPHSAGRLTGCPTGLGPDCQRPTPLGAVLAQPPTRLTAAGLGSPCPTAGPGAWGLGPHQA